MELKPYSVYDTAPEEGACLVFAHSAKEARKLGYEILKGWCWESQWIDSRARRFWGSPKHLYAQADQEKLANGVPHVIESPGACKICDQWGPIPLNDDGVCSRCEREMATDEQTH